MEVTLSQALEVARNLQSEDKENPEYDRALVELIRDLFGVGVDAEDGVFIVAAALDMDSTYLYGTSG